MDEARYLTMSRKERTGTDSRISLMPYESAELRKGTAPQCDADRRRTAYPATASS